MGDCLLWTGVLRLQIKSKMFCSSWHQMCIGVAMGMQSRARCANRATPQLSTTMFRPDPCTSTSTSTACMQQHEYEVLQQHHIHQRHYCLQQQQQWSHRVSFCQLQSIFCSSIQASTCYDANEEQHCCPSLSLFTSNLNFSTKQRSSGMTCTAAHRLSDQRRLRLFKGFSSFLPPGRHKFCLDYLKTAFLFSSGCLFFSDL